MLIGDIMNNSKKLVICTLIITLLVLAAAASPYSINADAFENVLGKVVFVFVLIVVISTATILNHLMLKDFEGKPDEGFRLPITEFFFGGKRVYITAAVLCITVTLLINKVSIYLLYFLYISHRQLLIWLIIANAAALFICTKAIKSHSAILKALTISLSLAGGCIASFIAMKKYEADCENLLFTIMLKFMFVLNIWLYLLAVAGFVYVSIAFVNYDILI